MDKPLVSVVSPCYNGEKKIPAFFESLLKQTYTNLEIIFINDGSVDNTDKICNEYSRKFLEKGIRFIYLQQENKGQAAAVNNGLQHVTGKYLTWPDSDDRLHEEYIAKKVDFLEKNPDLNMVISPIQQVTEEGKILFIQKRTQKKDDNLFIDLITGDNVFYPPGGYMIRTEDFFSYYPDRKIAENPIGQNMQMLLPMAYSHKYGYIDDVLYDYVVYNDSHSHKKRTLDEAIEKSDMTCDLVKEVMKCIGMPDKEYEEYVSLTEHEKYRRRFYFSIKYRDRKRLNESYKQYKGTGKIMPKIWLLHIVRNFVW